MRSYPASICLFTASFFGLIYGFGFLLFHTIALVKDKWPGQYEWCVTASILSYYIVYGTIYSSTLVTLEVFPLNKVRFSPNHI